MPLYVYMYRSDPVYMFDLSPYHCHRSDREKGILQGKLRGVQRTFNEATPSHHPVTKGETSGQVRTSKLTCYM